LDRQLRWTPDARYAGYPFGDSALGEHHARALGQDNAVDAPPLSERLLRREICAATGLLPTLATAPRENELFLAGTKPRDEATQLLTEDGHLLLPPEYAT